MTRVLLVVAFFLGFVCVGFVEGHRKGGKNGPLEKAPYLKGLNTTVTDAYHAIVRNNQLTKKQFREAVDAFVTKLPEENQKAYKTWKSEHEQKFKNADAKIASLSPAAKAVALQIKAIHDDLSLTREDERKRIHELRSSATEEVKKELRSLFPHERHGSQSPGAIKHGLI